MKREQEDAVVRITAAYVDEVQAGRQPCLGDYLHRYPQYADVLTDFVTYYHAVETQIPEEVEGQAMLALSAGSQMALQRVMGHGVKEYRGPLTLWTLIRKQHLSFSEVATLTGLSVDILEKLAQRSLDSATLPQEVFRRLAQAFQQPMSAMQEVISTLGSKQPVGGIAEAAVPYEVGNAASDPEKHVQSFCEAMEQSPLLSIEQKAEWRTILAREGL